MTFMTESSFQSNGHHSKPDLICFSHLRWDFVYQRPQHLMSRFAATGRVYFIEEPIFGDGEARLGVQKRDDELRIVTAHLPHGTDVDAVMPGLIAELKENESIGDCVLWFYTPMMLDWRDSLEPKCIVYDCMDELSMFGTRRRS